MVQDDLNICCLGDGVVSVAIGQNDHYTVTSLGVNLGRLVLVIVLICLAFLTEFYILRSL